MNAPGCFVVVEGGEGTGKSTQVDLLGARLRATGRPVHVTREPGATPLGAQIRALLLHGDASVDARAELLLVLADRAQHVAEVVRPRIAAGEVVVSDRYSPSTLAYQGAGRGFRAEEIEPLIAWATEGLEPDVVVVLDLPDEVAEARVAAERDRLERAGDGFHATVRAAYRALARFYGWTLVDATGTPDDVHERVWAAVRGVLP